MLDKLNSIVERYKELEGLLNDPQVIARQSEWQKHAKAHSTLSSAVNKFNEWKSVQEELDNALEMLTEKVEIGRAHV